MRQKLHLCGFFATALVLLTLPLSDAFGQKKDKKSKPKDEYLATPEEYAKIRNVTGLGGSLMAIDNASRTLTLRVGIPHYEPNPNYKPPMPKAGGNPQVNAYNRFQNQQNQFYQDMANHQQAAMNATNPVAYQRAMNRIQQDVARFQQQEMQFIQIMSATPGYAYPAPNPKNLPFKVVTTKKDYELEIKDDVVVRKMFLGTEYDDTGNIKTYTEKEKADLRGADKTKPGYTAKLDDLQPGQDVYLFLIPPKNKKKDAEPKDKAPAKDKDAKDKDVKLDDLDMDTNDRPTVRMIVMTKESSAGAIEAANPKKKK